MRFALLLAFLLVTALCSAQTDTANDNPVKKLSSGLLVTLQGDHVSTDSSILDEGPVLILTWATWCKPPITLINNVLESYGDELEEAGCQILAVSIDDERSQAMVKPASAKWGWQDQCTVLLDEDGAWTKTWTASPWSSCAIMYNGEMTWLHQGYSLGDEDEIYHRVIELIQPSDSRE